MPERNGNEAQAALERLKVRVDSHGGQFAEWRTVVKNLSDAMVVQARIEKRLTERRKA